MEINGNVYNDLVIYKISKLVKQPMGKVGQVIDFINTAGIVATATGVNYMNLMNGLDWNGMERIQYIIQKVGGPLTAEQILEKLEFR